MIIDCTKVGPMRTIYNLKHPSWKRRETLTVKHFRVPGGGSEHSTPHGDRRGGLRARQNEIGVFANG